jgi:hypothetical protein
LVPWWAFPAINEQHVAMMLTWPWWSLEVSACGHVASATLQPEAFLSQLLGRGGSEFKASQAKWPSQAIVAEAKKERKNLNVFE